MSACIDINPWVYPTMTLKEFVSLLEEYPPGNEIQLSGPPKFFKITFPGRHMSLKIKLESDQEDWNNIDFHGGIEESSETKNYTIKEILELVRPYVEKHPHATVSKHKAIISLPSKNIIVPVETSVIWSETHLNFFRTTSESDLCEELKQNSMGDFSLGVKYLLEKYTNADCVKLFIVGNNWYTYSNLYREFPGLFEIVSSTTHDKLFSVHHIKSSDGKRSVQISKCIVSFEDMEHTFGEPTLKVEPLLRKYKIK